MSIRIALAGNPNCGKTTMFNALTGSSQYVGNWPGVTVEKKEGKWREDKSITIVDLPGIYSLSPYTLEEVVTRNYLINDKPEVIINIIDASNIERNLYLTTQLMECGIPMVIALNMMDVVEKNGDKINIDKLSRELGCEVVPTSAVKGAGIKEVVNKAIKASEAKKADMLKHSFSKEVEEVIKHIEGILPSNTNGQTRRWYAIKLFERDEKVMELVNLTDSAKSELEQIILSCEEELDDDAESIITNERYSLIAKIIDKCLHKNRKAMTTSDKIDRIVTNRYLALPIFALIMFAVYFVSVSWLGTIVTDWTNDTLFGEIVQPAVASLLQSVGAAEWLQGLIVDGIIGGVGAVLGFVPQMMILFFFLSILEDCGYMARVAFIMDRIFRKFGLSGKSFIPMLISSGCGVPGIMATKTIESEKDRRMTIMTTTFIPCGAKLPVIALIGGAMFPSAVWMAPAMYFMGITAVVLSGIILKKTKSFAGDPAPFVMELPQYHVPAARSVLIHMWERGKAFVIKAGTVIFVACGVIWFLSNFGFSEGAFGMVAETESLLASLGKLIAPIFAPLGFGSWQAAVATVSGLVAKENVVGTLGVLLGLGAEAAENDPGLIAAINGLFPYQAAAMSFLVFNLLCAPCFAAIGAIKREMASSKWTTFALGYQTALAYIAAFLINQLGGLFTGSLAFGFGSIIALLLLVVILYLILKPSTKRELEAEQVMA